jgi:UBX domain-containing protein 6
MREKEELRVINRYKFTLIRIRFSDGTYLQGTFNVYETMSHVYEFVKSCLKYEDAQFSLIGPSGHKFNKEEDMEQSLFNLR